MNNCFRKSLFMLAAGTLVASCADYNVTDDYTVYPDPSFEEPYKDYAPVKTYIDRSKYANMSLGATLKVADFNKQELAHAAAVTNFDNISFGTTLMSGEIVNEKGIMNFLAMKDLLDHVEEIGGEVFGSPIAANANQADGWLSTLTAPIEIQVSTIEDKTVEYSSVETFEGTSLKGKPSIVQFEGSNVLKCPTNSKVYIVEGFDVDPLGKYTITFWARTEKEKDESVVCTFSDNTIMEKEAKKKFAIKSGKWVKVVIEDVMPAAGATGGYLMIEGNLSTPILIQKVVVAHKPDNHRPQTEQELNDTINYAMKSWCDGLMKINVGRIKSFDLIDEAIDNTSSLENGMYDLKHSTDKIFWQDIFGSDNYAPAVAKFARAAYQKYEGNPDELKFFISESGLEDSKKFESLKYWIGIWDNNGAKIDGINAKVNLEYSEDASKQAENAASVDKLLQDLASTGKLIRLSNFDIVYKDASGLKVAASNITKAQRQNLADYYKYVIQSYMSKIPQDKQAGICKGNMVDTAADPVGLWAVDSRSRDWVRTATYKAFCDALSGK